MDCDSLRATSPGVGTTAVAVAWPAQAFAPYISACASKFSATTRGFTVRTRSSHIPNTNASESAPVLTGYLRVRWVRLLAEPALWHLFSAPEVNPTPTFCARTLTATRVVSNAEPSEGSLCGACVERAARLALLQAEDFASR